MHCNELRCVGWSPNSPSSKSNCSSVDYLLLLIKIIFMFISSEMLWIGYTDNCCSGDAEPR